MKNYFSHSRSSRALPCLRFLNGAPPWTIQEVDGSPRVNSPTLIKVTNGTLSCTGKTCTITISGGGGGSPGGSNTQCQYNNAGRSLAALLASRQTARTSRRIGNLRATRPRFITSIDDTNGNEGVYHYRDGFSGE